MDNNSTLQKLINSIIEGIPEIQKCFDEYQEKFFTTRPPEFFCLELNGEAGELANAEKKIWKGKNIDKNLLAEEAADVFIALFNYVNARKIDLTSSLTKKLLSIEEKRQSLQKKGENY
ncbi:MAG: hypothetical protein N2560_07090 [Ignavibacteria bacterium]|nr:hypothetical protein [Ignavibacteria bacterium]